MWNLWRSTLQQSRTAHSYDLSLSDELTYIVNIAPMTKLEQILLVSDSIEMIHDELIGLGTHHEQRESPCCTRLKRGG